MKQRKSVVLKMVAILFVYTLFAFGCAGTDEEVKSTPGYNLMLYDKYITHQPKKEIEPIEVQDVDNVRIAICDIYNTTCSLTESYVQIVEASPEYHSWMTHLNKLSYEDREDVWNRLKPSEKETVLSFNKLNKDTYEKAVSLLPKAIELYKSVDQMDFQQVASTAGVNIFKSKSIMSGLNDSKDQIVYTVEVLKLMKVEYDLYNAFKEYDSDS